MELKTPLYETHIKYGGKIVPFAGYLMPVQYEGVIAEHMAVREKAGLFDVSHMGELFYEGPDALANLNHVLTNDFTSMADGRVRYSVMCNDKGGVIDDLIVYKFNDQKYMAVVNAANREKDVAHMKAELFGDVTFTDRSDDYALIALQGPASLDILSKITKDADIPKKYYSFIDGADVGGIKCMISQTGYTGELGFEIYLAPADASAMWEQLLETGKEYGLVPCGLGARDTLRLEASMPLYGHEMNEEISPFETGLDFGVKMNKEDFVGKAALAERGEPAVTRVGLKVTGRGIVREDNDLYIGDQKVGHSTSGTHCPYLGYPVAMALVEKSAAEVGTKMEADVRGRRIEVEVIPMPFYKKGN